MENESRRALGFAAACIAVLCLFLPVFWAADFSMAGDSPFGVCVGLDGCGNERVTAMLKIAGIKWVRQVFLWNIIEPEKGRFNWKNYDIAVKKARDNGIGVYGQLIRPSWSDPTAGDERALKDWAGFVSSAVERYKGAIHYWEVWNEQDCDIFWRPVNAPNYVKLLKATYMAAKKADPGCQIILGGLMGWTGESFCFSFLDDIYKSGGKDYFDILAIHPYTMPNSPQKDNLLARKIEDALVRMKNAGDSHKPIWITELGWPSNKLADPASDRGVTPDEQAEYLTKALEICLSYAQIKKVFWYCFRDPGDNPLDSEHHYGLIKNNFTPKPAYYAYKEFISKWKKAG